MSHTMRTRHTLPVSLIAWSLLSLIASAADSLRYTQRLPDELHREA
jgi:hypothetical protein